VADDVAHVLLGGDDLDRHDRLEQLGFGLAGSFLQRHGTGDLECHLRAVDLVVRAVREPGPHVDERVPRDDTTLHRFLDAGIDGGDVFARDDAALDLVDELVAAGRAGRLQGDHYVRVLTATTRLADVADLDLLDRLRDGLAVRDLGLPHVRLDVELAHHPVDEHLDVLTLVRVHTQDAPDALLAILRRVVDLRTFFELARVDAEVGQLAVGVGDDLERERGERLVLARLPLDRFAVHIDALGGLDVD